MGEKPLPAGFVPDGFEPDAWQAAHARSAASLAQFAKDAPAAMNLLGGQAIPGVATAGGAISDAATNLAQRAAANPVVRGAVKAVGYGAAYQAGKAMGISDETLKGLMLLAGAKEGLQGWLGSRGAAPEAPTAEPEPEAAAVPGAKVVPAQEPTLNDVISKALDALQKPAQPAKITTPPQAELPPGYTPRTTVPKPAAPRPYFLKPETVDDPTTAIQPQAATGPRPTPQSVDYMQLPPSWQRNTRPASIAPNEIEGSGLAAAFREELVRRGIQPADAIPLVLRNPDLPIAVKTQLVSALEKVARYQPQ